MLTVLFVEDDTAVRDVVMSILSDKGFTVLAASNAHEALRLLKLRPVDLLFTDIILPTMDGIELAKQARALRPALKVLFTTGYAQKAAERQAWRHGRVLYKPLRAPDLIQQVHAVLGV
jgi:two-component system cell cycle response regulator CpdR